MFTASVVLVCLAVVGLAHAAFGLVEVLDDLAVTFPDDPAKPERWRVLRGRLGAFLLCWTVIFAVGNIYAGWFFAAWFVAALAGAGLSLSVSAIGASRVRA